MIAALRFDAAGVPRFEPATNVRLDSVCAIANTVTDHLSRLLEREIAIDVFEPVFVPLGSHPALFADAHVFLAQARRSNMLVVFRRADARRLTACAFREEPEHLAHRDLSPHEERVLERIARELAHLCAPLTGEISHFGPAGGPVERYECATYFELRVAAPVGVTIGLGLAKDPAPQSDLKISAAAVAGATVDLRARLARVKMPARALANLRVGSIVGFETALADTAELLAGDTVVARGQCGVRDGVLAFNVTANPEQSK